VEHTEGGIDSTPWQAEASSSVGCWSASVWDVVECNGAGAGGTIGGVDSASVRTVPLPSLDSFAVNRSGLGGSKEDSGEVCREDIVGWLIST